EPTKAEKVFIGDLKKRVEKLKDRQDELQKATAIRATFQDHEKQARYDDERSAQIKELSKVEGELKDIYAAHKWELARELKPTDTEKLPDVKKNEHAFYREYFTQSLQPILDAWKEHLGTKFANAVKAGAKNTGMPDSFPENQMFVDIPGDGKFLVNNDPKVLDSVIRGAARGFAKPTFEKQGLPKPTRISVAASEPAKWSYLKRMEEEAMEASTEQERQSAIDTIGNILDFSPSRKSQEPGAIVEYHGKSHIVVGKAEGDSARYTILIPSDSEIGKQVQKWIDDGKPKQFGFDADKAEAAQIEAPNLLLKPTEKSRSSEAGFATPGMLGAEAAATHKIEKGKLEIGDTFVDETGEPRRVTEIEGDTIHTADGTLRTYDGSVEAQGDLNSAKARLAQGGKFHPVEQGKEDNTKSENLTTGESETLEPSKKVEGVPAKSSEAGFATPGMLGAEAAVKGAETIADAAKSVAKYVSEMSKATDIARDLQRGLETLDTSKQADILRGVQTMKVMKTAGMTHADDESIYHHLEDPTVPLKGDQEKWLDDIITPIQQQNTAFYQELTDGGVPIEDYVHRVVKGKAGM